MNKFLNSGREIDPLDVLKEIVDNSAEYIEDGVTECPWCEEEIHNTSVDVSDIKMVINKIEIQRMNNVKID